MYRRRRSRILAYLRENVVRQANIGFFEREIDVHGASKVLLAGMFYLGKNTIFYPLKHVTIWGDQCECVAILFPPERFYPSRELVLRQFLFENIDA